jgi:hypothetical protein
VIEFPSDKEILNFASQQQIGDPDVVLRDLARVATILHLSNEGFLGDDTVLAGGTALRLYGGHRFTVTDVDTSSKEKVKLGRLNALLNWSIEEKLEVRTAGVGFYEKGAFLEKAKPIFFDPLFSEIQLSEDDAQFELTVNMRGLTLDPVARGLRHDYPWTLGVEGIDLPLMDPREMLAEKVCGYCIGALGKHYADVAFIAYQFNKLFDQAQSQLRSLTEEKLERGRELMTGEFGKARYEEFPDLASLREPLEQPEKHLGAKEFGREVRFVDLGDGKGVMTLASAKRVVKRLVVPWLFG